MLGRILLLPRGLERRDLLERTQCRMLEEHYALRCDVLSGTRQVRDLERLERRMSINDAAFRIHPFGGGDAA